MEEFNTTINKIPPYLTSIYNKIAAKGGALPAQKNLHYVAAAIQSIPESGPEPLPTTDWGVLYTKAYPQGRALASQSDYEALCNQGNTFSSITFSFGSVAKSDITGYDFGSKPTSVGNHFLFGCGALNHPLTIPSTIKSIGEVFLSQCQKFNSPIKIYAKLTNIPQGFLANSGSFNQPLSLPNTITEIGNGFLTGTGQFNQPLIIPEGVTKIENSFLSYNNHFDQLLILPSTLTSIGPDFMLSCGAFSQPLLMPASVTSYSSRFMYRCNQFIGPLTVMGDSMSAPSGNNSLSVDTSDVPAYSVGVTILGSSAAAWKAALPDMSHKPYRKLILG